MKIKESKKRDQARELKKLCSMKVTVILIVIVIIFGKGDWKSWKLEDEPRPSKRQHCWDRLELGALETWGDLLSLRLQKVRKPRKKKAFLIWLNLHCNIYEGCSKSYKLHLDFRFVAYIPLLYRPNLNRN